jgi:hypothetical protein
MASRVLRGASFKEEKMKAKKTKEPQMIDPGAQYVESATQEVIATEEKINPGEELVRIKIPVELKLKRKKYPPGIHTVPRHVADSMVEMVDKKRRADISIFVGKNVLLSRMMDRTLVQTQVENLDIAKLVKS